MTAALITVGHLVAGLVTLYLVVWFSDSLDRFTEGRRFEVAAALVIILWPAALLWLLLRIACAPARDIIARRGEG